MKFSTKYDRYFINFALNEECPFDFKMFKAQAIVESQLDHMAVKPSGEIGIMMVHPKLARRFGYKKAELYNPNKNIELGIKYMNELYKFWLSHIFCHDDLWYFCLASYQAGPGDIENAFRKAKTGESELRDWSVIGGIYLPYFSGVKARATLRYVARVKRYYRLLGGEI